MAPNEIIDKWIGIGLFDDEPIVTEAEAAIIRGLRADIQAAITAAVEEKDKRIAELEADIEHVRGACIHPDAVEDYLRVCRENDRLKAGLRTDIQATIIAAVEEEREAIARLIEQAGLISLTELAKCVRRRRDDGGTK